MAMESNILLAKDTCAFTTPVQVMQTSKVVSVIAVATVFVMSCQNNVIIFFLLRIGISMEYQSVYWGNSQTVM